MNLEAQVLQVTSALHALYYQADPALRSQAQQWLIAFQLSANAWEIAFSLLSQNVCFFQLSRSMHMAVINSTRMIEFGVSKLWGEYFRTKDKARMVCGHTACFYPYHSSSTLLLSFLFIFSMSPNFSLVSLLVSLYFQEQNKRRTTSRTATRDARASLQATQCKSDFTHQVFPKNALNEQINEYKNNIVG